LPPKSPKGGLEENIHKLVLKKVIIIYQHYLLSPPPGDLGGISGRICSSHKDAGSSKQYTGEGTVTAISVL